LRSRTRLQHATRSRITVRVLWLFTRYFSLLNASSRSGNTRPGASLPFSTGAGSTWEHSALAPSHQALVVQECPTSWDDLRAWFRRSLYLNNNWRWLGRNHNQPHQIWQLVDAKYLSRTGQTVTRLQLHQSWALDQLVSSPSFGLQSQFQDRSS